MHRPLIVFTTAYAEPGASTFYRRGEAFGPAPISRIFVRSGRAIIPVAIDTIDWFEALGDYVAVHVGATNQIVHVLLNRLEQPFDPKRFVRIHRTHIVNLDQVEVFKRQDGGALVAQLRGGAVLSVSRAKAQELRKLAR